MRKISLVFLCCMILFSTIPVLSATENEYFLTDNRYVRLLGRGEMSKESRTFNWPNAGFEFVFNGTTASVYVDNATVTNNDTKYNGNYFTIVVYDGDKYIRANRQLLTDGWNVIYRKGSRDPDVKTIMVVRSSEAWSGTIKMSKLKADAIPKASEPRKKLIEFIGDSLTTGYANSPKLSHSTQCCAQNTDNWYCYTALVARHYNADNNVIANYGKGVYANRLITSTNHTMSHMFEYQDPYVDYPETNMSTLAKHDFTSYQPDVVTVLLGGNDLAAKVSNKDFKTAYGALIDNIRSKYPDAIILCISRASVYQSIIKELSEEESRGEANVFYFMTLKPWTTVNLGHPDIEEGERIAKQIIEKLDSIPNL